MILLSYQIVINVLKNYICMICSYWWMYFSNGFSILKQNGCVKRLFYTSVLIQHMNRIQQTAKPSNYHKPDLFPLHHCETKSQKIFSYYLYQNDGHCINHTEPMQMLSMCVQYYASITHNLIINIYWYNIF